MKALIVDKFESSGVKAIEGMGCVAVLAPDAGAEGLPGELERHDPDVLIVRSTKVKAGALEKARRLGLIIRAGAGVDNIDVAAASARGISVANCPGKNAVAVAELVWALILSCDRRVPDQVIELRAGQWNKKEYSKARGLHGRTLGIVGFGRIGREVAWRGEAFGMRVVAWSRSLTDGEASSAGVKRCATPADVAREADVVSVNVAATEETARLCDAGFFAALKPGAIFVNTSRGTVVDEAALLRAVREKGVRAGLDVFENEPAGGQGAWASETAQTPGVYGTHHVGASTDQAQQAIAEEAVRVLREYRETGRAPNTVNIETRSPATRLLTITHLNKPGVLARALGALAEERVNVEEMENVIYQGAKAACARIRLDSAPSDGALRAIRERCPEVMAMDLSALPGVK